MKVVTAIDTGSTLVCIYTGDVGEPVGDVRILYGEHDSHIISLE